MVLARPATLYSPGCLAATRLPELGAATKELLEELGLSFITLPGEKFCAHLAWIAGYEEEAATLMREAKRLLKERRVTRVVTNDPLCLLALRHWGVSAEHVITACDERRERLVSRGGSRAVTYAHSAFLDRIGVSAELVTRLLRRAGFRVRERRRVQPVDDLFRMNEPRLATSLERRERKELAGGEELLVTACPHAQLLLGARDVSQLFVE